METFDRLDIVQTFFEFSRAIVELKGALRFSCSMGIANLRLLLATS